MKLSKEQISQLKGLISKKGYPQVDVQYEILDHVACKIEAILDKHPEMSLTTAFQKVHTSFGIFGFSELESSYQKAIQMKTAKFTLQELGKVWTSWKALQPVLLTILYFQLGRFIEVFFPESIIVKMFLILVFLLLVLQAYLGKYLKQAKTLKNYASVQQSFFLISVLFLGVQVLYQFQTFFGSIHIFDVSGLSYGNWVAIVFVALTFSLFLAIRNSLANSLAETEKLRKIYEVA